MIMFSLHISLLSWMVKTQKSLSYIYILQYYYVFFVYFILILALWNAVFACLDILSTRYNACLADKNPNNVVLSDYVLKWLWT